MYVVTLFVSSHVESLVRPAQYCHLLHLSLSLSYCYGTLPAPPGRERGREGGLPSILPPTPPLSLSPTVTVLFQLLQGEREVSPQYYHLLHRSLSLLLLLNSSSSSRERERGREAGLPSILPPTPPLSLSPTVTVLFQLLQGEREGGREVSP